MIIVSLPITPTVPRIIVSSLNFWLVHLLIKFYNNWINFISSSKLDSSYTKLDSSKLHSTKLHSKQIQILFDCYFINCRSFQTTWSRCSSLQFEMERSRKKSQVLQWKDHYARIQTAIFMFQPENGFHRNYWFSISGKIS